MTSFPVVLARPFNHAGPRQSPAFVTSSFARQIAEIEAGVASPELRVGNLDARRDITDVRDTVRAYRLLARTRTARPAVQHLQRPGATASATCSSMLLARARVPIAIVSDPARLRPSDQPVILGNPSRTATEIGWQADDPHRRHPEGPPRTLATSRRRRSCVMAARQHDERGRKLVHLAFGCGALALRYLSWWQAAIVAAAALAFNLFVLPRVAGQLYRPGERPRSAGSGIALYPAGSAAADPCLS